jgi:ribosome-associated protein YbcJ (S4-like RNA binding protein)
VEEYLNAGEHEVIWNGENETGEAVTTGIYFYQLKINGETETRRVLMIK